MRRHSCAFIVWIMARSSFRLPPCIFGAAMPTATGRGVGTGQEAPPTDWQHFSCSLCPPLRFCVEGLHSFPDTDRPADRGRPQGFQLGRRANRRIPKIPHVTGTVNEHRPTRKGWREGLKGRRRGKNSDPCSEIKATTQRGLTLSFTMRHFSGSKRQTVDTELVSQGSHIICRRLVSGRTPPTPQKYSKSIRGWQGDGIKVNKN